MADEEGGCALTRIALDANVVVALLTGGDAQSLIIQARLDEQVAAGADVRIPVFCLGETWRVLTEPGGHGVDPDLVRLYLRELSLRLPPLLPDRTYLRRWLDLCARLKPAGAAIFDVQIAAVCLSNRVDELWTFDRRFPRVEGLTIVSL